MILEGYAVTYGVLDVYNTIFDRGVFDGDLVLPTPMLYAHQRQMYPVGVIHDAKSDDTGLWIRAELVPSLVDLIGYIDIAKAIDDSVGFDPYGFKIEDNQVVHVTKARLLEVSVTPFGAVPGAELRPVGTESRKNLDNSDYERMVSAWVDGLKSVIAGN